MKLIDRMFGWALGRAITKGYLPGPGGVGYAGASFGPVDSLIPSYEIAYEVNAWVHRGAKVVADSGAAVPIKLYEWAAVDGQRREIEVTDHPIIELIAHPGLRMSGVEFRRELISRLQLSGEAFSFVENGSSGKTLGGTHKSLRSLNPIHVADIETSPNGEVSRYLYRQAGGEAKYDAEFVTHMKLFHPRDDARGLSLIKVIMQEVTLAWYMATHNANFFKNGANAGVIFSSDQMIDQKLVDVMLLKWKKAHGGVSNAFKTAFLTGGFKPQSISISAKDGEFINLAKFVRDTVLALLGIPPVIVGVLQDVNYATSHDQMRLFYQQTIQPILGILCDSLNTQFVRVWYRPEYERRGLHLKPDYTDIKVLQEDEGKLAEVNSKYVVNGIMTPNEARDRIGLPPHDDEAADQLRSPGSGALDALFGGGAPQKSLFPLGMAHKAAPSPTRIDQWKARDRQLIKFERKYEDAVRQLFASQGKRAAAAVKGKSAFASAQTIWRMSVADIFDLGAEDAALLDELMPVLLDVVMQAGQIAMDDVGSAAKFKVTDPRVAKYIDAKRNFLPGINRTTADILRNVLADAADEGISVDETARRIRDTFEEFSKSRAVTIARTEAIGANNAAAIEGYRQSEVVKKKQWLSSRDDAVRDSHAAIDGDEVGLDEPFANGLMAPGVDGPPEEVINCRCSILPVMED